jgi:phage shock protein A
MRLFKRIGDIISANLNDITEQYEDPEKMLKQAIREMEASIEEATAETAKAMASQKLMAKELTGNESQARQWQDRAAQAVEAGDDALARKALGRKQEHDKLAAALHDQVVASDEASQTLRRQLEGMKAKLAEAKRSLATLSARKKAADFRKKMELSTPEGGCTVDDNAFAKFDRLREKVEQAEAEADALAELRRSGAPELRPAAEAVPDDLAVEAQLQELKKKMNK